MKEHLLQILCALVLVCEISSLELRASTTESGQSGGSPVLQEESAPTHEELRKKRREKRKKKKLQNQETE